ncbi:MAG: hypothetical protein HYU74_12650 [Dechloromonas sp.]|nr:hypothetical protein [Dechloromonas sp.]
MTPEEARTFAQALNAAADKAEAEGRDLHESDLDQFAALADSARADLAAVLAKRLGN